MKIKISLLVLFVSFFSFAQVEYEKGYIKDLSGNRTEVFIQNRDWSQNPTEFKYKNTLDSEDVNIGRLEIISEFGIGNYTKYVKATVDMDQSSNQSSFLSAKEEPEFMTRTVFLKQLVEGDANLYVFINSKMLRFFYNKTSLSFIPLVYKKYLDGQNSSIKENKSYKKELYDNLSCEAISYEDIKELKYTSKSLSEFFTNYNICSSNTSISYKENVSRGDFNFGVKLGVFNSRLDIEYNSIVTGFVDNFSSDLGGKASFRIGIEAEYVLPTNKNKWAIFVEPAYQSYSAEQDIIPDGTFNSALNQTVSIDYNYIDFPIGLRYYMFVNKAKLFLNLGVVNSINFTEEIEYSGSANREINSQMNFMFGFGYVFRDAYSVEVRLNTPRNLTRDTLWQSDYTSFGVILGYRFF